MSKLTDTLLDKDSLQMKALEEMLTRFEALGATPNDLIEYFLGVSIGIAQAHGFTVEGFRVAVDQSWHQCQVMIKDIQKLEDQGQKG